MANHTRFFCRTIVVATCWLTLLLLLLLMWCVCVIAGFSNLLLFLFFFCCFHFILFIAHDLPCELRRRSVSYLMFIRLPRQIASVCVCACVLVSLFLSLHVCMYVWLRVSFAILFHIHFTLFCLSRLIPCLGYVSTCQHLLVRWSFTKLHCSSKIGAMLNDFSFNKRGIFNMPIVTNEPWLIGPSFMLIRRMMIISNVSELSII